MCRRAETVEELAIKRSLKPFLSVTIILLQYFCYREARGQNKGICLFEILKAFLIGNYYNVTNYHVKLVISQLNIKHNKWPCLCPCQFYRQEGLYLGGFLSVWDKREDMRFQRNQDRIKTKLTTPRSAFFEFSELTILRMSPGGRQSNGLFFISWGVTGYVLCASMPYSRPPYSRPYINTYEHFSYSDQVWSIILTTDQLYLPQINYPNHWSAVPNKDHLFLQLISSP